MDSSTSNPSAFAASFPPEAASGRSAPGPAPTGRECLPNSIHRGGDSRARAALDSTSSSLTETAAPTSPRSSVACRLSAATFVAFDVMLDGPPRTACHCSSARRSWPMCCRGAARDGGCRAANAPLDDVLAVVAERQCQAVVATGSTRAGAPRADRLLVDTKGQWRVRSRTRRLTSGGPAHTVASPLGGPRTSRGESMSATAAHPNRIEIARFLLSRGTEQDLLPEPEPELAAFLARAVPIDFPEQAPAPRRCLRASVEREAALGRDRRRHMDRR